MSDECEDESIPLSQHELNCRRLLCPLPVIRTQNAIKNLLPGDELLVIATDPGVKADIPAWCRVHGHELVSIEDDIANREVRVLLRVKAAHAKKS